MTFHAQVKERYAIVAADSGLKYFRVDPLPPVVKKNLFLPSDEVIKQRHTERGGQADLELLDPKHKGMVLYSLGDYNKGPQRYLVVQMDDKGMYWIRPHTKQSNWSSHTAQDLVHTGYLPWHKELIMHPKLMTVEQFHKIKKVSELAPHQEHDTDTARKAVAALKLAGYKVTLGKKQLHKIPIMIQGPFKQDGKEAHLQLELTEEGKNEISGELQSSFAKLTNGMKVEKGDEIWVRSLEHIGFNDFDSGMKQLLDQIKKYEK